MALTSQRKKPIHRRKAHGEHHSHSKHYLKAYHPYLPLLLIVIVGLAVNVFWTAHTNVLGASTSLSANELLKDTNTVRLQNNQDELKLSSKLSTAAQAKANDMVKKNYWSHETPSGDEPWIFMKKSGYEYFAAGENLAYGFNNSEDTVTGWLNSPQHRKNMLSADYREVGFGIITAENFQGHRNTTVVVAMYAEPLLDLGGIGFTSAASTASTAIPSRNVARIQMLTGGGAPWSLALVTLAAAAAAAWFFVRHAKIWHKVVIKSEEFVVHHKMLDFVFVLTAVSGFVLTRAAGFIH
jgi:uncharacterized protein YkwD